MTTRAFRWVLGAAATALLLAGCGDDNGVSPDRSPPGIPRGVYTVTGDKMVTIYWLGSSEDDLAAYIVYLWNPDDEIWESLAVIDAGAWNPERPDYFYEHVGLEYETTYDYAISAVDFAGNESDLSIEPAFDTPRPEGFGVFLDATVGPLAAFDFEGRVVVPFNSEHADIRLVYDGLLDVLFVEAVHGDTDIQDFGYTEDFDVLDVAPPEGWSWLGSVELIAGHSYVVQVFRGDPGLEDLPNYAKFRVTTMGDTWARIDWAYQLDTGNPELKPVVVGPAGAGDQTEPVAVSE